MSYGLLRQQVPLEQSTEQHSLTIIFSAYSLDYVYHLFLFVHSIICPNDMINKCSDGTDDFLFDETLATRAVVGLYFGSS